MSGAPKIPPPPLPDNPLSREVLSVRNAADSGVDTRTYAVLCVRGATWVPVVCAMVVLIPGEGASDARCTESVYQDAATAMAVYAKDGPLFPVCSVPMDAPSEAAPGSKGFRFLAGMACLTAEYRVLGITVTAHTGFNWPTEAAAYAVFTGSQPRGINFPVMQIVKHTAAGDSMSLPGGLNYVPHTIPECMRSLVEYRQSNGLRMSKHFGQLQRLKKHPLLEHLTSTLSSFNLAEVPGARSIIDYPLLMSVRDTYYALRYTLEGET